MTTQPRHHVGDMEEPSRALRPRLTPRGAKAHLGAHASLGDPSASATARALLGLGTSHECEEAISKSHCWGPKLGGFRPLDSCMNFGWSGRKCERLPTLHAL